MALVEIKNTVTHKKVIDALFESDERLHQEIIKYFIEKFGITGVSVLDGEICVTSKVGIR